MLKKNKELQFMCLNPLGVKEYKDFCENLLNHPTVEYNYINNVLLQLKESYKSVVNNYKLELDQEKDSFLTNYLFSEEHKLILIGNTLEAKIGFGEDIDILLDRNQDQEAEIRKSLNVIKYVYLKYLALQQFRDYWFCKHTFCLSQSMFDIILSYSSVMERIFTSSKTLEDSKPFFFLDQSNQGVFNDSYYMSNISSLAKHLLNDLKRCSKGILSEIENSLDTNILEYFENMLSLVIKEKYFLICEHYFFDW